MKRVIAAGVALLMISSSANAWTKTDTGLELASEALTVADYGQTMNIARHPQCRSACWSEADNGLLRGNPSPSRVSGYFLTVLILHPIISYVLPSKWRHVFEGGTIALEASMVKHNYRLGIGMQF